MKNNKPLTATDVAKANDKFFKSRKFKASERASDKVISLMLKSVLKRIDLIIERQGLKKSRP